jgi:hypothetical protein
VATLVTASFNVGEDRFADSSAGPRLHSSAVAHIREHLCTKSL